MFDKSLDNFLNDKITDFSEIAKDIWKKDITKGKNLDNILKELGEVAEGVFTTDAILKLAKEHDIYTPIANEVSLVLEGKSPKLSLKDLLA